MLISKICVISTKEETADEVAAVSMHTVGLSGLVLIVTDDEKLDCNQKWRHYIQLQLCWVELLINELLKTF